MLNTHQFHLFKLWFAIIALITLSASQSCFGQHGKNPWANKTYLAEQNAVSPYDSLVKTMAFSWNESDSIMRKLFLDSVSKMYPRPFSMEWVRLDNKSIQRYIISSKNEPVVVLEKIQYPSCIIFFMKNGVPEHEMKFYKLLTAYYEE